MNQLRDRLDVVFGDITQQKVDIIVNAANVTLLGGGGVDGAIHRTAGPQLLEACKAIGGCPTGEARITKGYDLPAKWVIHAVGPIWQGGGYGEDSLLASAYESSLELAELYEAKSIAFPLISSGVFGFPLARACRIALTSIAKYLASSAAIEQIRLLCFTERDYHVCVAVLYSL